MPKFQPASSAFNKTGIRDFRASMQTSDNRQKGDMYRNLQNVRFDETSITWRAGHAKKGTSGGSSKVLGLGVLKNDPTDTLFEVVGQKLRKWTGSAFADTDLTNLTAGEDATLVSCQTKDDGNLLYSGIAQSGTTNRIIMDNYININKLFTDRVYKAFGFDIRSAIIFDNNGKMWLFYVDTGDGNKGKFQKYDTNGSVLIAETTFEAGNLGSSTDSCIGAAVDGSNNIFIAACPAAVVTAYKYNNSGVLQVTRVVSSTWTCPSIAVDSANNVWVAYAKNSGSCRATKYSNVLGVSPLVAEITIATTTSGERGTSIQTDSSNNVWFFYMDSSSTIEGKKYNSTGTYLNFHTSSNGILTRSHSTDIDSSGNIYVGGLVLSPSTSASIDKFDSSGNLLKRVSLVNSMNTFDSSLPVLVRINPAFTYLYVINGSAFFKLTSSLTIYAGPINLQNSYYDFDISFSGTFGAAYENAQAFLSYFQEQVWADDAFIGKVLEFTSGNLLGQKRLITGNDDTGFFIEGYFDDTPIVESGFSIYDVKNYIFLDNGVDSAYKHDGTTKTALSSLPMTKIMEFHKGYLFFFDNDRLRWSERALGEQVSINNFLDIFPDGDIATAAKSMDNFLVLYKKNSIAFLYGETEETFRLEKVADNIGCRARKSVAVGNKLQFFLSFRGIEMLNDILNSDLPSSVPISNQINPTLFDGTHSSSDFDNAVGWIKDNRYFLDIGTRRYTYHIKESTEKKRHIWSIDAVPTAITANSQTFFQSEQLLGSNTTSGQVYIQDSGTTDDSTAISFIMETHDLSEELFKNAYEYLKALEELIFRAEVTVSAETLLIEASYDGAAFATVGTFNLNTISDLNTMLLRRDVNRVAFRFSGSFSTTAKRFMELSLFFFQENFAKTST